MWKPSGTGVTNTLPSLTKHLDIFFIIEHNATSEIISSLCRSYKRYLVICILLITFKLKTRFFVQMQQ